MADFERRQLELGLEFVHCSSVERSNFSEGSSEPKKDVQLIRVRRSAASRVFELELLVTMIMDVYITKWKVLYIHDRQHRFITETSSRYRVGLMLCRL